MARITKWHFLLGLGTLKKIQFMPLIIDLSIRRKIQLNIWISWITYIPSSWSSVNKNQICIEWVCSLNSSGFNMSLQNSFGCIHFCRCASLFPSPIFMLYIQSFIEDPWQYLHVEYTRILKTNPFELKLY